MELPKHFDNLLTDTVNLPQGRLDDLDGKVDAIYAVLKKDDQVKALVTGKTPQGSWAQRTIIRPQNGKEYDADVLIHMKENTDWDSEKIKYLSELKAALVRAGYTCERHTRCVRVIYAADCHVDLVPYVDTTMGQMIVNADTGEWEGSDPDGFSRWMRERDEATGGNFRKVVRLIKFLRDHRDSFTGTRSIILTTVLGERVATVSLFRDPRAFDNVPCSLVTLIELLDEWLQGLSARPSIVDPSGTGVTFDHRWSDDSFDYFRDRIHTHASEMRDALDETDPQRSEEKWQAIFGDGFRGELPKATTNPFVGAGAAATSGRSGRAG